MTREIELLCLQLWLLTLSILVHFHWGICWNDQLCLYPRKNAVKWGDAHIHCSVRFWIGGWVLGVWDSALYYWNSWVDGTSGRLHCYQRDQSTAGCTNHKTHVHMMLERMHLRGCIDKSCIPMKCHRVCSYWNENGDPRWFWWWSALWGNVNWVSSGLLYALCLLAPLSRRKTTSFFHQLSFYVHRN